MRRMTRNDFSELMAYLPEPVTDKKPPFWEYWRKELWHHGTNGDDPARFFSWACIYHTMLQQHWQESIVPEYEYISINPDWLRACVAPDHVQPVDRYKDTPYSNNLIRQAYHLKRWCDFADKDIRTMKVIVEFGGGYGAMAHVAHRLGFRGEYHIFDLPEFLILQNYYLENSDAFPDMDYRFHSKPEDVTPQADLLVACYSLSEAPFELRQEFLANHATDGYLFLYSNRFSDYNNLAYFSGFSRRTPDYRWETISIQNLPPGSFYLFGSRL